MKNWKYVLKEAKQLRTLINSDDENEEENFCKILEQLQLCYKKLLEQSIFDDYERDDIEDALNLLDGDDIIVHLYYAHDDEFEDYGFDSAEDLVNDRLAQFYDLCDSLDVWADL